MELFIEEALTDAERATMMANLRGYRRCYDGVKEFGTDAEELDYYLSLNRYHAVTSPDFNAWLERKFSKKVHPEERKQFAIGDFVEHVIRIVGHSIATGGGVGSQSAWASRMTTLATSPLFRNTSRTRCPSASQM